MVAGTTVHVVIATDTLGSIAQTYGAAEGDILALNRLTPVEALQRGRQLLIPVTRPIGPQPIAGLPTFGSHRGQAAWGADLTAALRVTGVGDLEVLSGPAVLEQGLSMLLANNADGLLTTSQQVPDVVRLVYLSRRIEALVRSDPRIETAAATVTDTGGELVVSIEARAINSTGPLTFGV
jgi:LysM repeat protein